MALGKRRKKSERQREARQWWEEFYSRLVKIFVVILGITVLVNIIKRDSSFSEAENRMLAGRPELTWESVKSGKYMSEFESYVSDQFFMRNQWITLKLYQDKLIGKRESNGVYLGKKGYLMEVPNDPDWENVERNVKEISAFAKRNSDITTYMLSLIHI